MGFSGDVPCIIVVVVVFNMLKGAIMKGREGGGTS